MPLHHKLVARLRYNIHVVQHAAALQRAEARQRSQSKTWEKWWSLCCTMSTAVRRIIALLPGRTIQHSDDELVVDDIQDEPARALISAFATDGMHLTNTNAEPFVPEQPSAASILVLPAELIALILGFLNPREIASAQRICRYTRDIVRSSSVLQYAVEPYLACVEEGPTIFSLNCHAEKLRHLKQWKDKMHEESWEMVEEISEVSRWTGWGVHGTVVWRHDRLKGEIEFLIPPSRVFNTPGKRWKRALPTHNDFYPESIHYDSSQDLLLIVYYHTATRAFHFLAMCATTGERYHKSPWCTTTTGGPVCRMSCRVDIRGDYVAAHYSVRDDSRDEEHRFTVFDWKHQEILLTMYGAGEDLLTRNMTFIAPYLLASFIIADSQPAIVVFPFEDLPRGQYDASHALRVAVLLRLPALTANGGWKYVTEGGDYLTRNYSIDWNPRPKKQVHTEYLFPPSEREDSLIRFTFKVKSPPGSFNFDLPVHLLVHSNALASYVPSRDTTRDVKMSEVPWHMWGASARILGAGQLVSLLYGNHQFIDRMHRENGSYYDVLDTYHFDTPEAMLKDLGEDIVVEPSDFGFGRQSTFEHPALDSANLPYRKVSRYANIGTPHHLFNDVYIGENCIVAVEAADHDQGSKVRIYSR